MKGLSSIYLLALGLMFAPARIAAENTFTIIDYPGSRQTFADGINDAGDIVGGFLGEDNQWRGYLLRGGTFTVIQYPGARLTWALGINSRGDIVGQYNDGQKTLGFLLSQGVFTSLDCPPSRSASAYGINSAGDIAGYVYPQQAGTPAQGVVWKAGVCTQLEYRADVGRRTMTKFFDINDSGTMVGHWATDAGSSHGIIYSKGAFTQTDHGAGGNLMNWAINNAGDVAGKFSDGYGRNQGFLLRNGRLTAFLVPGARGTQALGLNNSGQIVGQYMGSDGVVRGYVARVTPAGPAPPMITVDDDGAECPGAVPTIQEAVSRAVSGSTILVCAGTYRGAVKIVGPEKAGLRLIAVGQQDEVVLQGDYTERDGFHLKNVTNVLIRGFTVRDFGTTGTTATVWGEGNLIYLEESQFNTIEHNRLINGDMMGIMLMDSGNNVIQNNYAWVTNAALANCGIHVQGAGSGGNTIRLNMTYGNKVAGIMIRGAGPGNVVTDNTAISNGRFGIDVQNTNEIWIEGNRVSYNRGFWGTSPGGQQPGLGINLVNVNKATVFDNRAHKNTGMDLNWDGKGENRIEANACITSAPQEGCAK
jgi:parallel beta-helix repeat protein